MTHEKEAVLKFLVDRKGKFSRVCTIARACDLPIKETTAYLKDLPQVTTRCATDGRKAYGVCDKLEKPVPKWVKPFTPMTPELYKKRIDVKGVVSV